MNSFLGLNCVLLLIFYVIIFFSMSRKRVREEDPLPNPKRGHYEAHVWTDGACSDNQSGEKAKAGVGVYFGPNDPKNLSEPLPGPKQTNQRAELWATIRALQVFQMFEKSAGIYTLHVHTDSMYVINGITKWIRGWKKNGWISSKKKPVENKDLWEKLDGLTQYKTKLEWHHVKGHSGNPGNEAADRLAVLGAKMTDVPRPVERTPKGEEEEEYLVIKPSELKQMIEQSLDNVLTPIRASVDRLQSLIDSQHQ